MEEQLLRRIQELEERLERIDRHLSTTNDESEIKQRADRYKVDGIEDNLGSQSVHFNLQGLNADDHAHYLNESRHNNMITGVHITEAATRTEHQTLETMSRGTGANRPTETTAGVMLGWRVAKGNEFYISDRLCTSKTGNGPDGNNNFQLHFHAICNNISANKQVSFELAYETSGNAGTVLGGAGATLTSNATVPIVANEAFQIVFNIPKTAFANKPYLLAKIKRLAIAGDPDPDNDPIVYKVCLLYEANFVA